MELVNLTRAQLVDYTATQIAHIIPDGRDDVRARIDANLDETLGRLNRCVNGVKFWKEDKFDYLHSSQYCIYLYYLSNTIWRNTKDSTAATKLFLLNKALNAIDCFYEIEMPEIFFIGHSAGIVLAKATYGNYLVLYQNSTVGKNHGVAPVIEDGVIMYPNTAIIGRCHVRANTVLSQGTGIVNQDTPGNALAFRGDADGKLVFKPIKHNALADLFRI
jgi:serine O-acetyltransferase